MLLFFVRYHVFSCPARGVGVNVVVLCLEL